LSRTFFKFFQFSFSEVLSDVFGRLTRPVSLPLRILFPQPESLVNIAPFSAFVNTFQHSFLIIFLPTTYCVLICKYYLHTNKLWQFWEVSDTVKILGVPQKQKNGEAVCCADIEKSFSHCADFLAREVRCGGWLLHLFWLDGLTDGGEISEGVIRPLTDPLRFSSSMTEAELYSAALNGGVWSSSIREASSLPEVLTAVCGGSCALLFPCLRRCLCFEVKSPKVRSVSPPTVEKSVKGGKDAFVESLRTNSALVRRRLRSPKLKLEQTAVGLRSGTPADILYYDGITDPDTVALLRERLDAIDIDGLISAGNLEQYLTDAPRSPFPQLLHTERPDRFASELLAGRVGILVDGLPMGFLLPGTLAQFMVVAEDRAQNYLVASALLLLRWLSTAISLLFPVLFVAVSMFHPEMIPTKLLLSMIEAKQQVPFSAAAEVLTMLVAFELLMEAGIRLPDPVGDTVSIIGALIVGQSAVDARIVSPITVIVVATTAICGFTQPSRDMGAALRLCRFAMVLLAIFLGLYGIMLGLAALAWYLCTLESFGVPYTAPMSEGGLRESLSAFLRPPLPRDIFRESALHPRDRRNQKPKEDARP